MKTLFFFAFIALTLLYSCKNTDPNLVTISGKITNPVEESVSFQSKDTIYSTTLSEEGTFTISFSVDSSMYVDFKHSEEQTAMYLIPGDEIYLIIDTRQFDETVQYQNSPTSSFLANKYLWWEKADLYGEKYYMLSNLKYISFYDEYKQPLVIKLGTITDTSFTKNELSELDHRLNRVIKKQGELQEFISKKGEDVRTFLWERKKIKDHYDFESAIDSLSISEFNRMLNKYSDTINQLLGKVANQDYVKVYNENTEQNLKRRRDEKIVTDNMLKVGEPASGFTYPDKTGHDVSLSSFKGNLVYIDVWATWCGPCIAEIPALKKLESEYHEKNIIFMSISLDEKKDTWLKTVNEKELGGIQLWAGNLWDEDEDGIIGIARDYAIYSIPRFLLISSDGKIISNDAPRPSSTKIRKLFDTNL